MVSAMSIKALMLALAVAASVAACFPSVDPPLADISKLDKLETVMHANETLGRRLWGKAGKESFTDAELSELKDLGQRMEALAERTKSMSRGPVFDKHAEGMAQATKALSTAVEAKDAKGAGEAITKMKQLCKDWHDDTR